MMTTCNTPSFLNDDRKESEEDKYLLDFLQSDFFDGVTTDGLSLEEPSGELAVTEEPTPLRVGGAVERVKERVFKRHVERIERGRSPPKEVKKEVFLRGRDERVLKRRKLLEGCSSHVERMVRGRSPPKKVKRKAFLRVRDERVLERQRAEKERLERLKGPSSRHAKRMAEGSKVSSQKLKRRAFF
jgi:hypothetical protein